MSRLIDCNGEMDALLREGVEYVESVK